MGTKRTGKGRRKIGRKKRRMFLFGLVVFSAALFGFEANLSAMPALFYASPLVAAVYLVLSLKYWFRIPVIGTGIGAVFLTTGVVRLLMGA